MPHVPRFFAYGSEWLRPAVNPVTLSLYSSPVGRYLPLWTFWTFWTLWTFFQRRPYPPSPSGATPFLWKGAKNCGASRHRAPSVPKGGRPLLLTRFNKFLMSLQFPVFPPDFKSFPEHEGCKTAIISNKLYDIFRYIRKPYSKSMIRKCSMLFPQKSWNLKWVHIESCLLIIEALEYAFLINYNTRYNSISEVMEWIYSIRFESCSFRPLKE